MKHNNVFTIIILLSIKILLLSCGSTQPSLMKAEKARLLDEQIENLDFLFTANQAYPLGSSSIHLSSQYDVEISPDTVKAYLPYYGQAYRAPMNSSDGGIKFESTDFESEVKKGKKNGEWIVTIRTRDASRPFTLYFNLWNNGTARLDVRDPDRQSIYFNGTVEERKKPK